MKLIRLSEASNKAFDDMLKDAEENSSKRTYDELKSAIDLMNSISGKDIWNDATWLFDGDYPLFIQTKPFELSFERDDQDIHGIVIMMIEITINDRKSNNIVIKIAPDSSEYNRREYPKNYGYRDAKDMYDQAEKIAQHILFPISKSIKGASRVSDGDTYGSKQITLSDIPTSADIKRLTKAFKDMIVK